MKSWTIADLLRAAGTNNDCRYAVAKMASVLCADRSWSADHLRQAGRLAVVPYSASNLIEVLTASPAPEPGYSLREVITHAMRTGRGSNLERMAVTLAGDGVYSREEVVAAAKKEGWDISPLLARIEKSRRPCADDLIAKLLRMSEPADRDAASPAADLEAWETRVRSTIKELKQAWKEEEEE